MILDKKSQQQRLIRRLRKGPATTIQLRKEEEIMMPAARVFELRHEQGYNIQLNWVDFPSDSGVMHRVGKYSLQPGTWRKS